MWLAENRDALAPISSRVWARLIDALLFVVPAFVLIGLQIPRIARLVERTDTPEEFASKLLPVFLGPLGALSLASAIYEVTLTARWGQTIGKRALGIRVVNAATGGLPGVGKAVVRWGVPAVPGLLGLVPLVGQLASLFGLLVYLWALWDPNRQGLHDKAAGTAVVRAASPAPKPPRPWGA